MRLLVAGGAGYIGSVVTAALLAEGHEVTVLDDLSTGHADAVPEGATLARVSLHDSAPVLAMASTSICRCLMVRRNRCSSRSWTMRSTC